VIATDWWAVAGWLLTLGLIALPIAIVISLVNDAMKRRRNGGES
jgi:hypothetical protein